MKSVPQTHSTEALAWLVTRGLLRGLLIVAIGAFAVVIVPRLAGHELLGVKGGSMGEALPHGSLVLASTRAAEDVEVGDIVVVSRAPTSAQIIHRVVGIDTGSGKRLATTRGDSNNGNDPEPFELSGNVTAPAFVLPYIGFLLIFVTTPLGWLLGVAVPAMVVTFLMIRDIWRDDDPPAAAHEHWTTRYGIREVIH